MLKGTRSLWVRQGTSHRGGGCMPKVMKCTRLWTFGEEGYHWGETESESLNRKHSCLGFPSAEEEQRLQHPGELCT